MRRRRVMAVLIAAALLVPVPAAAGGWWGTIELDKDPIAVGETVTATARISSPVPTEGEEASGYHAYLVRGIDREALDEAMTVPQAKGWWTPPSTRIRLGEVELLGHDHARARFTVPDVEPGLYGLMFCSADCTEPLADIIPLLDVAVYGDGLLAHSLRTLGNDPLTESHLTLIEERIGVVDEQVRALRADIDALRDVAASPVPEPASSPTPTVSPGASPAAASLAPSRPVTEQRWMVVAAALLAGAALAGMVVSLRQRRQGPHVPEEPRILEAEPASGPEPVGTARQ